LGDSHYPEILVDTNYWVEAFVQGKGSVANHCRQHLGLVAVLQEELLGRIGLEACQYQAGSLVVDRHLAILPNLAQ
jgi:hypothetical protein